MCGGVQEPGSFLAVEGGGARRDLWGRAGWTEAEFRCQTAAPCDRPPRGSLRPGGASGVTGDSCVRRCGRFPGPCRKGREAGNGCGHSIRSMRESWEVGESPPTLAQPGLEEICCMWHRPPRRVLLCMGCMMCVSLSDA